MAWAVFGAIGAALLLAGAIVAIVFWRIDEGSGAAPSASSSSSSARANAGLAWFTLRIAGSLAEGDLNGDGVPDFVGFCSEPAELCAIDGATFKPLWRKPAGIDLSASHVVRVGATLRAAAFVDAAGVAHLYDGPTGAELATLPLGARAEVVCAPPEAPRTLWLKTTDHRGLVLDTVTRRLGEGARPASCPQGKGEVGCSLKPNPRYCTTLTQEPSDMPIHGGTIHIDGSDAVMIGRKRSDSSVPMALGLTPRPRTRALIRWQRALAPGEGRTGGSIWSEATTLFGGRLISAYEDLAGTTHLLGLDAVTGRALWDTKSPPFKHVVLERARLYVFHQGWLQVRDAATGRLLGTIGEVR